MAQIVELYGEYILEVSLNFVINLLREHHQLHRSQREYLLKEWAAITNTPLVAADFERLHPGTEAE